MFLIKGRCSLLSKSRARRAVAVRSYQVSSEAYNCLVSPTVLAYISNRRWPESNVRPVFCRRLIWASDPVPHIPSSSSSFSIDCQALSVWCCLQCGVIDWLVTQTGCDVVTPRRFTAPTTESDYQLFSLPFQLQLFFYQHSIENFLFSPEAVTAIHLLGVEGLNE